MEMQNEKVMDVTELIKVESLPKLYYQLEEIGKVVDNALTGIEDMVCDEENKKEVKKRKQEITAFKNMMEDRRKQVKNQILEKYTEFENKYNLEVKDKLVNAESILNEKVSAIETQQKIDKENNLRNFYEEYQEKYNISSMMIPFSQIGLNITLTASEKSLKEQVVKFCEKISNDLKLIELEEYKDEIRIEYETCFDFVRAKTKVVERHRQLEMLEAMRKAEEEKKAQEEAIVEKVEEVVEEIIAPVEIPDAVEEKMEETIEFEEILEVPFTVRGYKDQIVELKHLLQSMVMDGKIVSFK